MRRHAKIGFVRFEKLDERRRVASVQLLHLIARRLGHSLNVNRRANDHCDRPLSRQQTKMRVEEAAAVHKRRADAEPLADELLKRASWRPPSDASPTCTRRIHEPQRLRP